MDPAFEHVPEDALPVIEGHHARARVIMGRLWGQSAPVTTHANTIYADISLQPGGSAPIDADADERAVYLAGGDAALEKIALRPMTAYVLCPGLRSTFRRVYGTRVMLCGGVAFATSSHESFNLVSSTEECRIAVRQD